MVSKIKIPVASPYLGTRELHYVSDAVRSTWISSKGPYINKFEKAFANFAGTKYATSTSNGTTGLHLALLALGLKKGDEVLVPNFTFIATANAVAYCGATPVFVDILSDTWCMDPADAEQKITSCAKGIIPVHIYGHPADMDSIMKLAKKHNLFVVEDAAEAHGAVYHEKNVGTFGDISVFSFFGNKIITTGEGGMVVSNNKRYMDNVILYTNTSFRLLSGFKAWVNPSIQFHITFCSCRAYCARNPTGG